MANRKGVEVLQWYIHAFSDVLDNTEFFHTKMYHLCGVMQKPFITTKNTSSKQKPLITAEILDHCKNKWLFPHQC